MKKPKLNVRRQGRVGCWIDSKMEKIMLHLSGTTNELPQRTHRWNNHHLNIEDVSHLRTDWMVYHSGDPSAKKFPNIPIVRGALSHLTRYGGWKRYLVINPLTDYTHWYIGWKWSGGAGVSRIPNSKSAKVTVGPGECQWFGIDAEWDTQIPLQIIDSGYIGDGKHPNVPLF